ncbi:response regulator [Rhodobacterales bacterium HKCCE2091]|nr:response regulator [Rhodobacterales bacterium HKCCE2091]
MADQGFEAGFADDVAAELPYLRRYARALTGAQSTGDAYAAAVLEAILADQTPVKQASSIKAGLFTVFHKIWESSGAPSADGAEGLEARAQARLAELTPNSREALLLNTIEEFDVATIAEIMSVDEEEARALLDSARSEMADAISGKVMIIEDEAIIALDLQALVSEIGHRITGVARTHAGAVDLAGRERPDLILADIQLADNSSGVEAVNEILATFGEIPVIFITAFPERLLTGERPEPAFLISKPYREEQVRSAVGQAMFFASTESLSA